MMMMYVGRANSTDKMYIQIRAIVYLTANISKTNDVNLSKILMILLNVFNRSNKIIGFIFRFEFLGKSLSLMSEQFFSVELR